jgi:hypothetical protein
VTAYALEPGSIAIAGLLILCAATLIGIGLLIAALVHLARL